MLVWIAAACSLHGPSSVLPDHEFDRVEHLKHHMRVEASHWALRHFEAGTEAFSRGALGLAYQHWRRAASMAPDWDLPLIQLAHLHPLYDNDQQAALKALEQAVAIHGDNPRSRFMYGVALLQSGRTEEAERELRYAIAAKPGYLEARLRLGLLYRDIGDHLQALEQYEELVRRQPANAMAVATLAELYEENDRFSDAEQAYQRLIGLHHDSSWALTRLADFYSRRGQVELALKTRQRAEELNRHKHRIMRPLLPSRR